MQVSLVCLINYIAFVTHLGFFGESLTFLKLVWLFARRRSIQSAAFTFSKPIIETEKRVKYVQS